MPYIGKAGIELTQADVGAVVASVEQGNPAGAVITFAGATPPSGYLECDGSAVSRSTYAKLFSVIGETYGVGDGSTTFNLPDLRGEFIRGYDSGRGVDSGRTLGSWQELETRWYHPALNGANAVSVFSGGPYDADNEGQDADTATTAMDKYIHTWDTSLETRPRNIAMMYCIKA